MRIPHNINPQTQGFKVAQKGALLLFCCIVIVANSPIANPSFSDFSKFESILAERYGPVAVRRGNAWRQELIALDSIPVIEQLEG